MRSRLTDEELVNLHRSTHQNLYFEALYKRYVDKVYYKCVSITKDDDNARDCVQEIFLKAFTNIDRFKGQSAFSTWLFSISHNHCVDFLRDQKRSLPTIDLAAYASVNHPWKADEIEEDIISHLMQSLSLMSEADANLILMKYCEGIDIRQISERYRITESAVKMRLKRIRERLRERTLLAQTIGTAENAPASRFSVPYPEPETQAHRLLN